MTRITMGTERAGEFVAIDGEASLTVAARFAPGHENVNIGCDFRRGAGLETAEVSLTIRDKDNTLVFDTGPGLGLSGDGCRNREWNGRDTAGQLVTPAKSPYTATLSIGTAIRRTQQIRVEIHSINVWTRATNHRIDMSNADQTLDTAATVNIKRTDGTAAPALSPMEVTFSFEAGGSNTSSADSYEYNAAAHRRLGKRGDANAVYWEADSRCTAASANRFQQTCRVQILTTGSNRGKAFVKFKSSGVGGDTYRIVATVLGDDGSTVLLRERGPELTVWRKIHFSNIYTMNGEVYIDTATSEAEIDPAFETSGYVMYSRGGVTTLSAALSPQYLGLYVAGGGTKSWPNDLSPERLESSAFQMRPTADELSQYAYIGINAARRAQKNNAKAAIERKAALWFNAVVEAYRNACDAWFADAGIPTGRNVILAVRYYHPKLSGLADGATNFWPAGIQINLANPGSGLTDMGDPDRRTWRDVQGFNRGSITVVFKNYGTAANLRITCRHEIGHGTRSAFRRDIFGTGDHSAAGLMTPYGDSNTFSNADILILRGYHR